MPRLDFYSDYNLFIKIKLATDDVEIGRSEECTVQLPDDHVSRVHAVIKADGAGHLVEDHSSNGTRVNGDMVEGSQPLLSGDRIYISKFIIIYQPDDAPEEHLDRDLTLMDN